MPHDDDLFESAGSLRLAYASTDWAATPLGPVSGWSPALRNAVDITLHTRFPVTLFWGPQFVLVYNEAYTELIADKHPAALGATARAVFPEAWDTIGPMMEQVLAGGGATWVRDEPVPLRRHGFLEECYFTFSYSPVRGPDGTIEGVMDIAAETTREVIDRRRLQLLGRLAEALGDVERAEDVAARALPLLRADADDFPAVAVRLSADGAPDGADGQDDLPTAAAVVPANGGLAVEETAAGRVAWLPLTGSRPHPGAGVLVVALSERLAPDGAYLAFLRLVARTLAEALDRVAALTAERGLSEALQRSLLTTPPEHPHLQVAARYRPAAALAQVGGDWYDSYLLPDGSLTLVIGDVAGHDQQAAAAMAQVRNLLRGVSYTLAGDPPAGVLHGLDGAMHGLATDVFATAVLAHVAGDGGGDAPRLLRWSNAGHPPPVLVTPDGSARLLSAPADPLLGLLVGSRSDHVVALAPGSSVVFYTDGLVERRGVALDRSLAWLTEALTGCHALTPEQLCDHLLALVGEEVEDDVALLVLRT